MMLQVIDWKSRIQEVKVSSTTTTASSSSSFSSSDNNNSNNDTQSLLLLSLVTKYQKDVFYQLQQYVSYIVSCELKSLNDNQQKIQQHDRNTNNDNNNDDNHNNDTIDEWTTNQTIKTLLRNTRDVLRFILIVCSCSSSSRNDNDDDDNDGSGIEKTTIIQQQIQQCQLLFCTSIENYSIPKLLFQILSLYINNDSTRTTVTVDTKILILSTKVLSNLVTCNYQVAEIILDNSSSSNSNSSIPLIPSDVSIRQHILQNTIETTPAGSIGSNKSNCEINTVDNHDEKSVFVTSSTTPLLSWMEIILQLSGKSQVHDAFDAIVVCLHNGICSLSSSSSSSFSSSTIIEEKEKDEDEELTTTTTTTSDNHIKVVNSLCNHHPFIYKLASCQLLISTLLRQFMNHSTSIIGSTGISTTNKEEKDKEYNSNTCTSTSTSSSSEWITCLLCKLCNLGYFSIMYQCIGTTTGTTSSTSLSTVLPEQLILLNMIYYEIENNSTTMDNNNNNNRLSIFGCTNSIIKNKNESNSIDSSSSGVQSILFLCKLYTILQENNSIIVVDDNNNSSNDNDNNDDLAPLRVSARDILLEIIALILTDDTKDTAHIRLCIGMDTISMFIQTIIFNLNTVLNHINIINKNSTNRTRDFIFPLHYQSFCIIVTRIIGNLVYNCQYNQDLIRTIEVPYNPIQYDNDNNNDNDNDNNIDNPTISTNSTTSTTTSVRNGIHVLLSITSISHSCLSLREWSIIATRYILENNYNNQCIVDQLVGTNVIQSTILDDIGIKVNLNITNNKISIQPKI